MYVMILTEYYRADSIAPSIDFQHAATREDAMRKAAQWRDDLKARGRRGAVEVHALHAATLIHSFAVPAGASPSRKRGCRR